MVGWLLNNNIWIAHMYGYPTGTEIKSVIHTPTNYSNSEGALSGYHVYEILRPVTGDVVFKVDGAGSNSLTNALSTALKADILGQTQHTLADYFAVRKYAATEPSLSFVSAGVYPEVAPTAGFTATPTRLDVQFTNTTAGSTPLTYEWDFGDGGSSTDASPSHTYAAAGTYSVTLTATNAFGTDGETQSVVVTTTPLNSIGDVSGTAHIGFVLTAGAIDPVGATATYQWEYATAAAGPYSSIPGATASTYTIDTAYGGYYIRVIATGTGGYSGTATSDPTSAVTAAPPGWATKFGNVWVHSSLVENMRSIGTLYFEVTLKCWTKVYSDITLLQVLAAPINVIQMHSGKTKIQSEGGTKATLVLNGTSYPNCYIANLICQDEQASTNFEGWWYTVTFVQETV